LQPIARMRDWRQQHRAWRALKRRIGRRDGPRERGG